MSSARTNYIYVDYENIQAIDLKLIHDKPHVKVILMLGSQHKRVGVDLMKEVAGVKHPGQVTVTTVEKAGRNALDMAMAYEIGRQVAVDPKAFFHILSGDGDYDALVSHLKVGGVLAAKSAVFAEIPVLVDFKKLPLKARLERVSGKLSKMRSATKDGRPIRLKSLESMIYAHFSEQLTMADVSDLVTVLKNGKRLKVSDAGKVTYSE